MSPWPHVPAAGAVLADWGADVIQIAHPLTGDAQRGVGQSGTIEMSGTDVNPSMEFQIAADAALASTRETQKAASFSMRWGDTEMCS